MDEAQGVESVILREFQHVGFRRTRLHMLDGLAPLQRGLVKLLGTHLAFDFLRLALHIQFLLEEDNLLHFNETDFTVHGFLPARVLSMVLAGILHDCKRLIFHPPR